jgi:hypothetical protein
VFVCGFRAGDAHGAEERPVKITWGGQTGKESAVSPPMIKLTYKKKSRTKAAAKQALPSIKERTEMLAVKGSPTMLRCQLCGVQGVALRFPLKKAGPRLSLPKPTAQISRERFLELRRVVGAFAGDCLLGVAPFESNGRGLCPRRFGFPSDRRGSKHGFSSPVHSLNYAQFATGKASFYRCFHTCCA